MTTHPLRIFAKDGQTCFAVWIQPRASRNQVQGVHNGALKILLTSPPLEDRANRQLLAFLSRLLRLPASRISLLSGHRSRAKTIAIKDLSPTDLSQIIAQYLV